jgi:hypothetical protein
MRRSVHHPPRLEHLERRSLLSGVGDHGDDQHLALTGAEVSSPGGSSSESSGFPEQIGVARSDSGAADDSGSNGSSALDDKSNKSVAQAGMSSDDSGKEDSTQPSTQKVPTGSTSAENDGHGGSQTGTIDDNGSTDDGSSDDVPPPAPVSSSSSGTGSTSGSAATGSTSTSGTGSTNPASSSSTGNSSSGSNSGPVTADPAPTTNVPVTGPVASSGTTVPSSSGQAGAGPTTSPNTASTAGSAVIGSSSDSPSAGGFSFQFASTPQLDYWNYESGALTVTRSGDEFGASPEHADHGTTTGLSANGASSVAGTLDFRSNQPPTFFTNDPEIRAVSDQDAAIERNRPIERTSNAAGGLSLASGPDHGVDIESLRFRGADVLASCSPYQRGELIRAIDRFLDQLGGNEARSLSDLGRNSRWIPGVALAMATVMAMETMRQRSRPNKREDGAANHDEELEDPGFPGAPGSRRIWALEER